MEKKEIYTTTLRRKARNLLIIMLALIMIILLIYLASGTGSLFGALTNMLPVMLGYPILSLIFQYSAVLPLFIATVLSISSSVCIWNIIRSNDRDKITKSFIKLKKKVIIMVIFDCIVFIWFCVKGFPEPFNYYGTMDIFQGIVNFLMAYFYSIFNIIYTGILWIITDDEDEIEVEDKAIKK